MEEQTPTACCVHMLGSSVASLSCIFNCLDRSLIQAYCSPVSFVLKNTRRSSCFPALLDAMLACDAAFTALGSSSCLLHTLSDRIPPLPTFDCGSTAPSPLSAPGVEAHVRQLKKKTHFSGESKYTYIYTKSCRDVEVNIQDKKSTCIWSFLIIVTFDLTWLTTAINSKCVRDKGAYMHVYVFSSRQSNWWKLACLSLFFCFFFSVKTIFFCRLGHLTNSACGKYYYLFLSAHIWSIMWPINTHDHVSNCKKSKAFQKPGFVEAADCNKT